MTVIFPKWTNHLPTIAAVGGVLGFGLVVVVVTFLFSPNYTDVGYAPKQPVPYSHKLHAGLLGFDCRYCHQNVEDGPHASVPSTATCMNCHTQVKAESELLAPVRASAASGDPVEWVKVHMLPDYVYFDHSVHVNLGGEAAIGCTSCHGRVDQMEVVRQEKPLSMSWCLECHMAPEHHLRPIGELTNMEYAHDPAVGERLKKELDINPPIHCSACHR